jgi:hypothetical protein
MAQRVPDRRRPLIAIAVLLALGEYVDAFFISFPAGAAGLATFLLLAVFWTRRGGIGGPIAAAALFAFEDANAPFWPRTGLGDWITTIGYGGIALAGLLVALAVIRHSLGRRRTRTGRPVQGLAASSVSTVAPLVRPATALSSAVAASASGSVAPTCSARSPFASSSASAASCPPSART